VNVKIVLYYSNVLRRKTRHDLRKEGKRSKLDDDHDDDDDDDEYDDEYDDRQFYPDKYHRHRWRHQGPQPAGHREVGTEQSLRDEYLKLEKRLGRAPPAFAVDPGVNSFLSVSMVIDGRNAQGRQVYKTASYTRARFRHETKAYRTKQLRAIHCMMLRPSGKPPWDPDDAVGAVPIPTSPPPAAAAAAAQPVPAPASQSTLSQVQPDSIFFHQQKLRDLSIKLKTSTRSSDLHKSILLRMARSESSAALSRLYHEERMFRQLKFNTRINADRSIRRFLLSIPARLGLGTNFPVSDCVFGIGDMSSSTALYRTGRESTRGARSMAQAALDAGFGVVVMVCLHCIVLASHT